MAPQGYDAPFPHTFRGRALYQLSLVKTSEARRFVPPELPLVELFGYTLGGLYLARYDQSPAGAFDEMVALAGLVWNAPTSCAWAAKVYVNNAAARRHGVQEVGLPSHVARFTPVASTAPGGAAQSWWSEAFKGGSVRVDCFDAKPSDVCCIWLPPAPPARAWRGPRIRMVLPNFSGRTPRQPALLRYSLSLMACVRPCAPARVDSGTQAAGAPHALAAVLGGRPLLTLAFEDMRMDVGAPVVHRP